MANEGTKRGIAERAIVMQVLREDRPERWSRTELERELSDIAPLDITDALARLQTEGVVVLEGEQVRASGCARYLDALNLICI
jgi:DNA-binding HxlR family transcriptional regulator